MSHSHGGMPWAISIIAGGTAGGVEAAATVSLSVQASSDAYRRNVMNLGLIVHSIPLSS